MQITIGFSSPKNKLMPFAVAIEKLENRKYSHVYIKYNEVNYNLPMVLQASHGIVHEILFEKFIKTNNLIKEYSFNLNQQETLEFEAFRIQVLGSKYGWLQILAIFWRKLTHLQNPMSKAITTFICSELGAFFLTKIKKIEIKSNLNDITPSDLDIILMELKNGKIS